MIRRVPEASGMKNEVIIQRSHRFSYDHAIRNVGVTLVEVETEEELRAAVNDRTAMMFFLNYHDPKGDIKRARFAELAKELGIPSLIDAAADLPPAENLRAFTALGYDMVAFSGGRGCVGLSVPDCCWAGRTSSTPRSSMAPHTQIRWAESPRSGRRRSWVF